MTDHEDMKFHTSLIQAFHECVKQYEINEKIKIFNNETNEVLEYKQSID